MQLYSQQNTHQLPSYVSAFYRVGILRGINQQHFNAVFELTVR